MTWIVFLSEGEEVQDHADAAEEDAQSAANIREIPEQGQYAGIYIMQNTKVRGKWPAGKKIKLGKKWKRGKKEENRIKKGGKGLKNASFGVHPARRKLIRRGKNES